MLVTTHYLDEAEYCNNLVFMHAGEIIARGRPKEIKQSYQSGQFFEIQCDRPLKCVELLKQSSQIFDVSLFETRVHVHSTMDKSDIQTIVGAGGIDVEKIDSVQPRLEDVFIGLIEHRRQV